MNKLFANDVTKLGMLLAFVAGAINAGGFFAVSYYTSHMTGIVSSIADHIALYQIESALAAIGFLLSFIFGAASTSIIVNYARLRNITNTYAPVLLFESLLLLIFYASTFHQVNFISSKSFFVISLLCFIMGGQNALITKISHARIRTTHVTGLVTDIGIALGRKCFRYIPQQHSIDLQLNIILVASFLIGGVLGAFSFKIFGSISTLPLVVMLAWQSMRMKHFSV